VKARPRWGLIGLLGCISGLSAFGMASVVPALPVLGKALSADAATAQFLVSAYLLGLGLCQPVQGLLCDRFGRRPVLLAGFSLFALASVAAVVADGLATLAVARFVQATGVSVATVVTRAIVRDTHGPEEGAVALSFITAVMGIAPIIAPIAGGLVTAQWGWRAVFWLHTAIALVLLTWMALALRESRPAATRAMTLRQLLAGFATLLHDRVFVAFTLAYSFISAGSFAFITVGAALFERLFAMHAAAFGTLWAALALAYLFGAAAAGAMSRRFGSRLIIERGLWLNVAAAVCFLFAALQATPMLVAFMLALMLQMAANGLVSPLCLAGCVSERPGLAGVASGLSSAVAMLLAMLCAAVSGVVFDGTAHPVAVLLLLCACAASLGVRPALGWLAASDRHPGGQAR
jgi:DHA1 family bicyclomycin/chloramphenicol resistance-like MFS transporter